MSLLRSLSFKAKKERPASTTAAAVSLLDEHGEFETYDALLSYDWGDETDGYLTKARVETIEAMLVEQNVKVWRDETHMPDGLSREALTKGVMQSDCILVFVTKQYMDRLDDPLFKCSIEFELALTHTRGKRMIPCVLDAEMLDSSKWTVPLVHLAKADIVDMTSEAAIAESIPGLVKRVLNAML